MSTGYSHEGFFFDIKVNQIGKIFVNFGEKIYENEKGDRFKSGMTSSQLHSTNSVTNSFGHSTVQSNRQRKVVTLVLDFSTCMSEVGAAQLKMAAVDFIKTMKADDFLQVIIQNSTMPVLISGSQEAREIEFADQFEPFRSALQDATYD